jgi:hypothetical protein
MYLTPPQMSIITSDCSGQTGPPGRSGERSATQGPAPRRTPSLTQDSVAAILKFSDRTGVPHRAKNDTFSPKTGALHRRPSSLRADRDLSLFFAEFLEHEPWHLSPARLALAALLGFNWWGRLFFILCCVSWCLDLLPSWPWKCPG